MMLMRSLAAVPALLCALVLPAGAGAGASAPAPARLLLKPADLPTGYVRDDMAENADATARTRAYSDLIAASAFTGYRTTRAAVVHYVALLHRRQDVPAFLMGEAAAVDSSRGAARITLASRYGDAATLAYQARGDRGENWVIAIFADGPYVTMLGSYDGTGEQAALDTLQHVAASVDARLRAAARLAPAPARRRAPPLAIMALRTSTTNGRLSDVFKPHSTIYWRVVWGVSPAVRATRETLREQVRRGGTVLYANGLTDKPFPGNNALSDHLPLKGAAAGTYTIAITITIGRLSAHAAHTFRVAMAAAT